jgi:hypothetical protein
MILHPIARAAIAACCLAGLGAPAGAATLGLTTYSPPEIAAMISVFNDPGGFNLYGEGTGTLTLASGASSIDFTVTAVIGSDGTPANGMFQAFGAEDEMMLESTSLIGVGFIDNASGDDVIELLFELPSGSASTAFGPLALARMFGQFGSDPFGAGFGDFVTPVEASMTLNPVVIPLPAGGALLLTGLGALAGLRRRR